MKYTLLAYLWIIACFVNHAQVADSVFSEFKCGHTRTNHFKSSVFIERDTYQEYDLIYNTITWEVDPAIRYITGKVSFTFSAIKDQLSTIQIDLHDSLRVDSIVQNDDPLLFSHVNHTLTIQLNKKLSIDEISNFSVYYHGIPPETGSGSFVTQLRENVPELWTLSEPYGAMEWWPCKQSLQDKIDSIDITIKVPAMYKSATNGLLMSDQTVENQNISKWKHRYPITTYLVGIAVTNYVEFSEYYKFSDNDSMLLFNRMFPEYLEEAKKAAENTPKFMQLFSDLFIPYPFKNEWYGHAQFSRGGGMEHQTMSFMKDLNFELLSHELAHQWFGNYITLNSWHDIWLNEGFATYLSGIGYEYFDPGLWYRWKKVRLDRIVSKPDGSVYVQDTTNVSRIFDGRLSYFKGAYVLLMLRWELGDDTFYKAIKNYLNDPRIAYGFTSQDILVEHFELTADTLLSEFFKDWYYGEGYPLYNISWRQENEKLYLEVMQYSSHESVDFFDMHIPFHIITEKDTTEIRLKHSFSGQLFEISFADKIQEIVFDPEIWLVSSNSVINAIEQKQEAITTTVYPNPASTHITITNENHLPIDNYLLYTLNGKLVLKGSAHASNKTIVLPQTNERMYLLRVQNKTFKISVTQ